MGHQSTHQKKSATPTRPQSTKTSVKSPVHPVEELQAAIGNREMGQYIQSQSNHRSSPLPHELTLPSKITPIQAKPQFGGLSSELIAASSRLTIQPKLTIGEPGDQYEQEADRVAAEVVNRINNPSSQPFSQGQPTQRKADTQENDELQMKPLADTIQRLETPDDEEDDELQMKPMLQHHADPGGLTASSNLEASIQRLQGSGQPLAKQIREPMEQAFGANFSGVKVHVDAQSDGLNQSIQAKAFTTGQDIFFRQGAYKPESRDGQELLAHELTHVVQQRGMGTKLSRSLQRQPFSVVPANQTVIQCDPDEEKLRKRQDEEKLRKRQDFLLKKCQGQIQSSLGVFSLPPKDIYTLDPLNISNKFNGSLVGNYASSHLTLSVTDANLMALPLKLVSYAASNFSPGAKDEIQLTTDIGSAVFTIVVSSNPLLAGIGIAFAIIKYLNAQEQKQALEIDKQIENAIAQKKAAIIENLEQKILAKQEALLRHGDLDKDKKFVSSEFGPMPVWGYAYLSEITYMGESLSAIADQKYGKHSNSQKYWLMLDLLYKNQHIKFENWNEAVYALSPTSIKDKVGEYKAKQSFGSDIFNYMVKIYEKYEKGDLKSLMNAAVDKINNEGNGDDTEESDGVPSQLVPITEGNKLMADIPSRFRKM